MTAFVFVFLKVLDLGERDIPLLSEEELRNNHEIKNFNHNDHG